MRITVTGLSHRTAPVELRERFAFGREHGDALRALAACEGVRGAVILSTCNRVELYTLEQRLAPGGRGSASFLGEWFGIAESEYIDFLHRYHDEQAARHLFGVAAGLDSMVRGEPQILGQVRQAYQSAVAAGTAGGVLGRLFERALAAGKRVRHETRLGRMGGTVAHAAVDLTRTVFHTMEGRSAAILGRGAMSGLAAAQMRRAGVARLVAVNRTAESAAQFAGRVHAEPRVIAPDLEFLDDVDVLLCCSRAPYQHLTAEAVESAMRRRGGRMLLVIDISVPRGVDPAVGELENVLLYNIDDLQTMTEGETDGHAAGAGQAAGIVEQELARFREWRQALDVVPCIRGFRGRLDDLREAELRRVLRDCPDLTADQRARVEEFGRALVNKLAHRPTRALKDAPDPDTARRLAECLDELFGPADRNPRGT